MLDRVGKINRRTRDRFGVALKESALEPGFRNGTEARASSASGRERCERTPARRANLKQDRPPTRCQSPRPGLALFPVAFRSRRLPPARVAHPFPAASGGPPPTDYCL